MFNYTFSQEQEERMRELMSKNGRTHSTPNEKASQIVDRGLGALELGIKTRETQKELIELGRQRMKEIAAERPTSAPVASFREIKS